ncbi:MAG: AIR synthase-related protein, partial [Bacteroidales bacterium]
HVVDDINCSEYLYSYKGIKSSPAPYFDIEEEYNLHHALNGLILEGLIASAHDISDGGLFTTLIESAMPNDLGFEILTDSEIRLDSYLFGESQGRVVVTIDSEKEEAFLDVIGLTGVPCCTIGSVTKGKIIIDDENFGNIKDYKVKYNSCFANRMEK